MSTHHHVKKRRTPDAQKLPTNKRGLKELQSNGAETQNELTGLQVSAEATMARFPKLSDGPSLL